MGMYFSNKNIENGKLNHREALIMKLVILDIDGTLVRTGIKWCELRRKISEILGISIQGPIAKYLNSMDIDGRKLAEAEAMIIEAELKSLEKVRQDRELIQILKALKSKGIKVAVVTLRSKKTALPLLKKLGIADLLDLVLTREDSIDREEQLKIVLDRLDVKASEAVFFGDIDNDLRAGGSVGIKTILVPRYEGEWEFNEAKVPEELKKLLNELLRH